MSKSRFTHKLLMAAVLATSSVAASPALYAAPIFAQEAAADPIPEGSTVEAYKLFEGTFVKDGSNFGATKVFNTTALVDTINHFRTEKVAADATPEQLAEALSEVTGTQDDKTNGDHVVANYLAALVNSDNVAGEKVAGAQYTFDVKKEGYYVVVAKDANGTILSANLARFTPADDTAKLDVTLKLATKPVVTKEISKDGENFGNEAQIGVLDNQIKNHTYRISGTVPANYTSYNTYKYNIHDVLPSFIKVAGDNNDDLADVKVTAFSGDDDTTGKPVAKDQYTETYAEVDGKSRVTWAFANLKDLKAEDGSAITGITKITVTYKLNPDPEELKAMYENVATEVVNGAFIEFSNHPTTDGIGKSNETETKVHHIKLLLNKVNDEAQPQPLKGAEFELFELVDGNKTSTGLRKEVTADTTTFEWTGLEAGSYILEETKAPAGYKKTDPIEFTITDDGTVITVTETKDADKASWAGNNADGNTGNTVESAGKTVEVTVVNNKGPQMPVTGEAGITIATVAGLGILVLSAGAMARKKKED